MRIFGSFFLSALIALLIIAIAGVRVICYRKPWRDVLIFCSYLFLSAILSYFIFGPQPHGLLEWLKIIIVFPGGIIVARSFNYEALYKFLTPFPYVLILYVLIRTAWLGVPWMSQATERLAYFNLLGGPNTLGFMLAFAVLLLLLKRYRSFWVGAISIAFMLVGLFLLALTSSRSAVFGLIFGLGFSWVFVNYHRLRQFLWLGGITLLLAALIALGPFLAPAFLKLHRSFDVSAYKVAVLNLNRFCLIDTKQVDAFYGAVCAFAQCGSGIIPVSQNAVTATNQQFGLPLPAQVKQSQTQTQAHDTPIALSLLAKLLVSCASPGMGAGMGGTDAIVHGSDYQTSPGSGRFKLWRGLIKETLAQPASLVFGFGPGLVKSPELRKIDHAMDSLIILALHSYGIIGLVICIWFLWCLLFRRYTGPPGYAKALCRALAAFLVFTLVVNNSTSAAQALLYGMLAIALICAKKAGAKPDSDRYNTTN